MRARFSSPLGEPAITLRAVRADWPGMRPKAHRVTCVSPLARRETEKERKRRREREKGEGLDEGDRV